MIHENVSVIQCFVGTDARVGFSIKKNFAIRTKIRDIGLRRAPRENMFTVRMCSQMKIKKIFFLSNDPDKSIFQYDTTNIFDFNTCNINPMRECKIYNTKLDRYIYPKVTPPPPDPNLDKRTRFEILKDIINLCQDRLSPDLYRLWSEVCMRDVQFQECSSTGIGYPANTIRKQIALFKKEGQRLQYVQGQKDKENEVQKTVANTVIFENQEVSLEQLMFDKSLLQGIILHLLENKGVSKKVKKALRRFQFNQHVLGHGKYIYYLKLILYTLKEGGTHEYTINTFCLPEVDKNLLFAFGSVCELGAPQTEQNVLLFMLDTGAEINLISESELIKHNIHLDKIQKTKPYSVRSTTETVKDTILGKINLRWY